MGKPEEPTVSTTETDSEQNQQGNSSERPTTDNTDSKNTNENTTKSSLKRLNKYTDIKVLWLNAPVCRSVYKEIESVKHTYEEEKHFRELEYKSCIGNRVAPWMANCSSVISVDNHSQAINATKKFVADVRSSEAKWVIQVFNGHGVPDDRDKPTTSDVLYHEERKLVDELSQDVKEIVQPLLDEHKIHAWWLVYGQSFSYLARKAVDTQSLDKMPYSESDESFTVCCLTKPENPHTMNARNLSTQMAKHFNLNKFFKDITAKLEA